MKKCWEKPLIWLVILTLAAVLCMTGANAIQTAGGKVTVIKDVIKTDLGDLAYKLYVPKTATKDNPAPSLLLLHGYQNDKETGAAYAIEAARRGVVVMVLDEYGHGDSKPGMINRGYVNQKFNVLYGTDKKDPAYLVTIGGPERYRIMMTFSNLSFFDPYYSTDKDGNKITDSSMGGILAYATLANMDITDASRMAISGHSMGTWSSWSTAAAYWNKTHSSGVDMTPKAVILQCGELFTDDAYNANAIKFNNVLLLQAKYDEFSYFRDFANTVDDAVLTSDIRTSFLGTTPSKAAWDTTFGNFTDGSARRMELLKTNHRLVTCDNKGIAVSMNWLASSIGVKTDLSPNNQISVYKEVLALFSMLFMFGAMIAFMELLLTTGFFEKTATAHDSSSVMMRSGKKWWKGAVIALLVSGITYPFMTQLGHGLVPFPENIFKMTVGNGFLTWYVLLILISLITTMVSWKKSKKRGTPLDYADLGFSFDDKPDRFGWGLLGKSALLVLAMLGYVYIFVFAFEQIFHLDFRFVWPLIRAFSGQRLLQFLVYIPIFALFFILTVSKLFAQMRHPSFEEKGFKAFLSGWYRYAIAMAGGAILIALLEYIPFFMNIGPGVDLLFGSTFGGPFISLLIVFIPQVILFAALCTYIYRRTRNIYTAALTVSAIAAWIITSSSSFM